MVRVMNLKNVLQQLSYDIQQKLHEENPESILLWVKTRTEQIQHQWEMNKSYRNGKYTPKTKKPRAWKRVNKSP